MSGMRALPADDLAADTFDRLRENRRLRKIGRADLLIASIVMANRAVLVTRNRRHFGLVPGLSVEDWAE
jgi:tRNA(fMet)-specific endonuclease VapC